MIALIITCVGIVICIILSGVFSAAEMSLISFNKVRMENEAEDGSKRARRVLKLSEDYDNTLSTILLSNNLVNIAASALSTVYLILLTGSDDLNWLITAIVTILVRPFRRSSVNATPIRYPEAFRDLSVHFITYSGR